MENTLEMHRLSDREIFYFRQRQKNRFYQALVAHFSKLAESEGLSKRDLATLLGKDPSQITRWLSGPGNWTSDTISDLLLAMGAELDFDIVSLSDSSIGGEVVELADSAIDAPPKSERNDLFKSVG